MQAQQKLALHLPHRMWLQPPSFSIGAEQLGHGRVRALIQRDVSSSPSMFWVISVGSKKSLPQHGHPTDIGRISSSLAFCAMCERENMATRISGYDTTTMKKRSVSGEEEGLAQMTTTMHTYPAKSSGRKTESRSSIRSAFPRRS
mmetsp:Transcript_12085/g.35001  ORF Transcript_12085/g.35001 Transcript_12085/m.35001 type:complete len:145 (+) Transcript_12085:1926-2360(+)